MTYWGIELKAGKPYIHRFDNERGRLHVSQAKLGTYSSTIAAKKVVVQCSVGDKMPIYVCSLLPNKRNTCKLNLEFEEDDEVTFSVRGPHSVHLSGNFYADESRDNFEDDFGPVILAKRRTLRVSVSSLFSINDDDIDVFPPSPVPNSGVRIEEIKDDDRTANESVISQPKKKKNKLSGSDYNDNSWRQIFINIPVIESEDEDGFPISSPVKIKANVPNIKEKTVVVKDERIDEAGKKKKEKDDIISIRKFKRKIKAIPGEGDQSRDTGQPFDSSVSTSVCVTDDEQARKNKKKKVWCKVGNVKSKKQGSAVDTNVKQTISSKNGSDMDIEVKAKAKQVQARSFRNGLVIEELGKGKPNGKRAKPGRKVSVHYIGNLKKSGKIFDSNIGRAPFKFCLGIGRVIKGWDVGIDGMRVGDKRRITIPPYMGYGAKRGAATRAIPPNAWLVFDVELVDIWHKRIPMGSEHLGFWF